ncbi:hypothetical protein JTB14_010462 [Gonioctena quinquepunctata]|nr:hypothetical protein JTB14_010462 [Gonioctena quinquepunctata]
MADIETSKKNRKVFRMCFTRAANELDGHLKQVPLVFGDVEISWECLKPKWDSLSACDNEVYNSMLDGEATEEQLKAEMEQCEAYLRRFTGLRLQVGKLLLKPVDEQSIDGDTVDPRKDESQSDQSIRRKEKKTGWVKGRKRKPLTPEAQAFPLDIQPEPELAMPNDQLEKS